MDYFTRRKVERALEALALAEVDGFYSSYINRTLNLYPKVYSPFIEELANQGFLVREYVLLNPDDEEDSVHYKFLSEIPLNETYQFDSGSEVLVSAGSLVVYYKLTASFIDGVKSFHQ